MKDFIHHLPTVGVLIKAAIAAASATLVGNVNTAKQGVPNNNIWVACPSAVTSGMPVLLGTVAAVALDAYDSSTGGTTFQTDGEYFLTIIGQSTQSPNSVQTIKTGDQLFASGTVDATTNVTYNLTIDKTRGNVSFGNYMGLGVVAGVTDANAIVRLKFGA